ncbi:DUF2304 domain-containing protein [Collinsella vaginalis]|uniref:DUF2304 domain-containing protein n=1 Tax=Collinsella vaginalis TaxID=1870987 RepID=UPI000A26B77A|nr:DUF2304 domain-containing protein [Collinsella vaginalis]
MATTLRILLIVSALMVTAFVARRIRKGQFSVGDSLFWLILSFSILLSAIFPGVPIALSQMLGITSPSNFVFLVVIALLLIREFTLQMSLSQLRSKLTTLVQEMALDEHGPEGR